jgi:ATP adenylyltransferase
MKRIYAPWRHKYVSKTEDIDLTKLKNECVFCDKIAQETDKANLILRRFEKTVVVLNQYPYSAGHLMVLPIEHKATLDAVCKQTRTEMMELSNTSTKILGKILKSDGFNIGINLGRGGGGGIPAHLHMHVLPRWEGDTNFMVTLGDTKMVCSDFFDVYDSLKSEFDQIKI